ALKVGRLRGDRERKIEDALGLAGGDQADNGGRGIRVARHVAASHRADEGASNGIVGERTSEIGDDLVVGASIDVMEPASNENPRRVGVEDAEAPIPSGFRRAVADTAM